MQSSLLDGVAFDYGLPAAEVDVARCQVLQALVVTLMIVVVDEATDVRFQITGQVVVFEQDAVLERLMPPVRLAGSSAPEPCRADYVRPQG